MRWAQDSAEAIKAVPPMDVDECRPTAKRMFGSRWLLLAGLPRRLGKSASGLRRNNWPVVVRRSFPRLWHTSYSPRFNPIFRSTATVPDTKTIIATLNESGDFADVNYGRGLTPHYVAKLLKPYGIEPARP